jgi:hypothetical protein
MSEQPFGEEPEKEAEEEEGEPSIINLNTPSSKVIRTYNRKGRKKEDSKSSPATSAPTTPTVAATPVTPLLSQTTLKKWKRNRKSSDPKAPDEEGETKAED